MKSMLHRPGYKGLSPSRKLRVLETLIRQVEWEMKQNALGHQSAADVMAALWEMGLDPEVRA